ncbi:Serine/threonine-protein kinase, partial [Abortiporus biennis]
MSKSSLISSSASESQVMHGAPISVHSQATTIPVPKKVIKMNAEIMGLQAAYNILKNDLGDNDRRVLESSFDLWKKGHKRFVEAPAVERSLNPAKILAYMWSLANRRREVFKLSRLAATTRRIYIRTSGGVRTSESAESSRPNDRNVSQRNDHADGASNANVASGNVPPLSGSHDSATRVRALDLGAKQSDNDTVEELLPQDIASSLGIYFLTEDESNTQAPTYCAVCHTPRDDTDLFDFRNYYVCTSIVQPKCGEIAATVDNFVEECVLGIDEKARDDPELHEYVHGKFFDKFRVVLVTDYHDLAAGFIQTYKDDQEYAQLALDIMQKILDTKLSLNADWRRPNIIRTRLCRLLGNFARECDHISFPSSLAVTVEPVTRPPPTGGGFAIVSFGHLLPDKTTMVAIKTQKIRSPEENDHDRNYSKRFLYELMIWRNMSHRCIAKFIGFSTDGTSHALVIQYFQHGSLEGHLPNYLNKTPIETIRIDCRRWILDVAEGLLYLHLQGYAHGDIHGGNILLDENLHAVISDFGTAVYHDAPWYSNGSIEGRGGRRHFLAPELLPELDNPYDLKDKRPTKAGDVFSFGSVSSQMHNGLHAYGVPNEDNPAEIISVKIEHIRKFWEDGRSIQKPHFKSTMEYMEDGLWNILSSCFHFHPQDRPGIEDIFRQLVSYFGI